MDFYKINTREIEKGPRKGEFEIYPDFTVGRSQDLMIRGRSFYAIWDEANGLWSTDEYDVQRLVDEELTNYANKLREKSGIPYSIRYMESFNTNVWSQFRKFILNVSDNSHDLDQSLTFANTEIKKTDYISKRLPYRLEEGDISAWNELVGTLYSVEERAKIEWTIGAIVSGDSKKIQKFLVLYGPAGTGKSTILNVVMKLFQGYTTTFDAKALGSSGNAFATEAFKNNPLVAIQQDGDLSKIEDNTKLNSIISHEYMPMNEKYKSSYTARVNAFLLMGTNKPVKISDAKSGIIRRLIDVHPTGVVIPANHYNTLISRIDFELGAIAYHCLGVYREMGRNYYSSYRPVEMMFQTDIFFNYIEAYYDVFKEQDGVSLKQAYDLYKEYCSDSGVGRPLPQYLFRSELRNYFDEYRDRAKVDGVIVRSYYRGFNANKFKAPSKDDLLFSLVIDDTVSLLDEVLSEMPAQYSRSTPDGNDIPERYWDNEERMIDGKLTRPKPDQVCDTTLKDINTNKLHFVKVPENHIVIDFDLKDESGKKSLERNLQAASVWPSTYAELSKSGSGVHLHYIYDGDVSELSKEYSEGIEIKTLLGNSSLRRKLTKCNNIPVATFNGVLPLKEKKVLNEQTMKSEKAVRKLIAENLQKLHHPGTKSSVDFIKKILDDAYNDGLVYDVTDLRPKILAFANNASNQSIIAMKTVQEMKFKSEHTLEGENPIAKIEETPDDRIVFYDVEVYPNLLVVVWKYEDGDSFVRMINPSPQEVEALFKMKLVGFNNRRYDNHILYARYLGWSIEAIYGLSQKIINNDKGCLFPAAYNISYADIYDFSSKKQSLKKFEIELGIRHLEMDLPWDQPVKDEDVERVADYCANDVEATEATFKARKQDFLARQILADLSGLTVNDTTQKHTAEIIFEGDKNPQASFVYTDLSKDFPGYVYEHGKSTYKGEVTGEGGYVYAEPGMYENVVLLDVASMHPTSIEQLNLFGKYTPNFAALKSARMTIKHKDFETARTMLNGKLRPFLEDEKDAEALSYALKIVINIVYGLTSASFDNPFRDRRNKDNIVAKRGALFMIDLKEFVQSMGLQVVHIKTDSIKIPNPSKDDIQAIVEFGKKWGYDFEHEATYDKFCLVNDAVYIAKEIDKDKKIKWSAVGAQFAHPYVYKKLFSEEEIVYDDLCETKQVSKGAIYLDFEHDRPMALVEGMRFVGKTGRFVPVVEGESGAVLYRVADGKNYAVTGTKGYLWLEAEMAKERNATVDMTYFEKLADKAVETIEKFGQFEDLVK